MTTTVPAPILTVTSPKPNSTLVVPFTVAFHYTGPVSYYKCWIDGVAGDPQYGSTFICKVTKLTTGKHVLACQAHDPHLNKTITQDVNITVGVPVPVPPPVVIVEGPVSSRPIQSYFPRPVPVLAHVMPWFGPGSAHKSARCPVYDSADPTVVARQITQMKTMGLTGINIDYYGLHDSSGGVVYDGRACPVLLAECVKQGLWFAVQPDHGIMKNNKSGIPAQTFFEDQITEVLSVFCTSPAYLRTPDGRFVMMLFGAPSGVDMGKVAVKFPQAAFVYQGNGGYGQAGSAGAFAWTPLSGGNTFYSVAPGPGQVSVGNLVQGFDDHDPANPSQSCWGGAARKAPYGQGQTFLDSVAAAVAAMNGVGGAHPPAWLQLVTWNDFEEGTNFELGSTAGSIQIAGPPNNGVTISSAGAVSGGNPKGVDHTGQLSDGRWVAVGKPMFLNKVSAGVL